MIEEMNKTVMSLESLDISVPYIAIRIENGQATMHVTTEVFDKIREKVDPMLIMAFPSYLPGEIDTVERSILIGTVLVFALYGV